MVKEYPGRLRPVKGRELRAAEKVLVAKFPYNAKLVATVKEVPGRRWNVMGQVWTWPLSAVTAQRLVDMLQPKGFTVDPSVTALIRDSRQKFLMSSAMRGPEIKGLYPFQSAAVAFADKIGGRLLIGDEMGIGKTLEGIAIVAKFRAFPCLVVCPAAVKLHWQRHIIEWAKLVEPDITVVKGRSGTPKRTPWYVVNYELLNAHLDFFTKLNPKSVIIDEAHYIKNRKAKRSEAVIRICAGVPVVIALDGTPFMNRPVELFNILNLLQPEKFPRFFDFGVQYCNGHRTPWGWDFSGASNLEDLNVDLRTSVMIRRTKDEVLEDLPPKQRAFLPIEIPGKAYRDVETTFMDWVREQIEKHGLDSVRARALTRIGLLRRHVVKAKMGKIREWIKDFRETGKPLVVFTHHKQPAWMLSNRFKGLLYTGDVTRGKRDQAIDDFQEGKNDLIFLTIDAGGEGITLNRASDVLFTEFAWNCARLDQAEDRLHRIGQKGSVTCWYMYAQNTIDEDMIRLLNWKRKTTRKGLGDIGGSDVFAEFLKEKISGERKT